MKHPAVACLEKGIDEGLMFFRGRRFEIALVPLDEFIVVGDLETKLKANMELISTKKSVLPIVCMWDYTANAWLVADGHHRVRVCRKLGYTHIPACIDVHSGFEVIVDTSVVEEQRRIREEASRAATIAEEKRRVKIIEYTKLAGAGLVTESDIKEIEKEGIVTCKKCKRPQVVWGGLHCLKCENVALGFYGVEPKQH